jgi:hypothetical protein
MGKTAMSQHVAICINAVGDPKAFPELDGLVEAEGKLTHVVILEKGTKGGQVSLCFCVQLPNGRYVLTQTTANILLSIAAATNGAIARFAERS